MGGGIPDIFIRLVYFVQYHFTLSYVFLKRLIDGKVGAEVAHTDYPYSSLRTLYRFALILCSF